MIDELLLFTVDHANPFCGLLIFSSKKTRKVTSLKLVFSYFPSQSFYYSRFPKFQKTSLQNIGANPARYEFLS